LYMARPIMVGKAKRVAAVAEVSVAALTDTVTRSGNSDSNSSGGGFEISLERSNGQLLASVPPHEDRLGTLLTPPLTASQSVEGALTEQPGRLSTVPAIVVSRSMLYPGLLMAASLPMDAALKLGVEGPFRNVPPQFGYWLGTRARRGFGTQPSTWQNGLKDTGKVL